MPDLNTQVKLADYRLRVLNREPITMDEYRQLMNELRSDRESAARKSAAATRTAKRTMGTSAARSSISLTDFFPGMSATQEGGTDGTDDTA